jgi:hypothetical protein
MALQQEQNAPCQVYLCHGIKAKRSGHTALPIAYMLKDGSGRKGLHVSVRARTGVPSQLQHMCGLFMFGLVSVWACIFCSSAGNLAFWLSLSNCAGQGPCQELVKQLTLREAEGKEAAETWCEDYNTQLTKQVRR